MKKYSLPFLRMGLGLVILYFGSQQLSNPIDWISFLPSWTQSLPISQITFIYLNGWVEICLSILLILNLYTKIVSGILTLHLLGIVFSLGYNPTAVRDFGLAVALFSIFLNEENWLKKPKEI